MSRLVELLEKRDEMMGLVSNEYDELLLLLEEELKSVKDTLEFYENLK